MVANIFFIYNRIMLTVRTQNIPPSMIEDAVNILAVSGLSVDKSVIPAKKPANYVYEGVYSGDFKQIVTGFSGTPEEEIQDLPPLPLDKTKYIEGGYIFIFDKSDYLKVSIMKESHEKAKEDYRVTESETEEETALLLGNAKYDANAGAAQKSDIKKAGKIIRDFLKKYQTRQKSQNQDIKEAKDVKAAKYTKYAKYIKDTKEAKETKEIKPDFDIEILSIKKEIGFKTETEKIIIKQKTDGLPINSHIAYVEIKDGEVWYFCGTWYFGNFVRWKTPLLDAVNILFKYAKKDGNPAGGNIDAIKNIENIENIEDIEKTEQTKKMEKTEKTEKIVKIEAEYNVLPLESDKFYLRPSWVLVFEDGKKLSYDMIKGNRN